MLQITWEPTKVYKASINGDVDAWCKKKKEAIQDLLIHFLLLLLLTLIYVFIFNVICYVFIC